MPLQVSDMTDHPDIVLDIQRLTKNCNGKREIVLQLLRHLCQASGPKWHRALEKGIQDGDSKQLQDVCHGMKGACATVFAWRLSNLALEFELLTRDHDIAALASRLGELPQRIVEVERWIDENCQDLTDS